MKTILQILVLGLSMTWASAQTTNIVIRFIVIDGNGTNLVQTVVQPLRVLALYRQFSKQTAIADMPSFVQSTIASLVDAGMDSLAASQRPYPMLTNSITGKVTDLRSLDDQYAWWAFALKYGLVLP